VRAIGNDFVDLAEDVGLGVGEVRNAGRILQPEPLRKARLTLGFPSEEARDARLTALEKIDAKAAFLEQGR